MKRLTQATAKAIVKALGYQLTYTSEYQEYRISGADCPSGYYTTDLDDAVGTANAMYLRRTFTLPKVKV